MSKDQKTKKRLQYFKVDKFVSEVIRDCKFENVSKSVLEEIEQEILATLGDRILRTVIKSFRDRELKMFEKLMDDHPELEELDVLWLVAHEVDGLKEKLMNEINSLHSDMVYNAEMIDEVIESKNK